MNAAASVEEVRRYCRCEAERRATDGGKVQSPVLAGSRRSLRNPENGKSDPLDSTLPTPTYGSQARSRGTMLLQT